VSIAFRPPNPLGAGFGILDVLGGFWGGFGARATSPNLKIGFLGAVSRGKLDPFWPFWTLKGEKF